MPAARALSSPSGTAIEDNVDTGEYSFSAAEYSPVVTGYGLRTDRRTDGQRDVEVEILY